MVGSYCNSAVSVACCDFKWWSDGSFVNPRTLLTWYDWLAMVLSFPDVAYCVGKADARGNLRPDESCPYGAVYAQSMGVSYSNILPGFSMHGCLYLSCLYTQYLGVSEAEFVLVPKKHCNLRVVVRM